jgi:hypothetical protein
MYIVRVDDSELLQLRAEQRIQQTLDFPASAAHRTALLQELNLRRVTSVPKCLNIERQRFARLALSNAWVFSRIGVSGALA